MLENKYHSTNTQGSDVESYRPVSLFCSFSKVFEKIIFGALYLHV